MKVTTMMAGAALALVALPMLVQAAPIPDDAKINGFAIGCQAWTFNKFTAFEAIDKTAQAGAKVIEFYPGQHLSAADPKVLVGPEMSDEQTQKLKDKLAEHHLTPVAFGVTGIPRDENGARKLFTWAKTMGIGVINTESTDAIDTIEKMVKEFDIKVGFHDHPKQPNNPNYKMWDPNYILSVVKDRDARIGSCADTGHWVRSGLKPVDCLKILDGRIMSSHLKDLNVFAPNGHDMPYGEGVSDVNAILTEFQRQKFDGPISIEYEYHQEDNLAEVTKCIDYIRNWKPAP